MNLTHELNTLLFVFVTLNLLIWPFYPAWREWRHPSDAAALTWLPAPKLAAIEASNPPSGAVPAWTPRPSMVLARLPNAQPWGMRGSRIEGDCHLPSGSYWPGSLVITGSLFCGAHSVVEGDVKVYGDVHMSAGSALLGAAFASALVLEEEASVQGPVVVDGAVKLGSGASIGSPDTPTSLRAKQLTRSDSAHVHGHVWLPENRAGA